MIGRLRHRDDFRVLAARGRRVRSGPLALTFATDPQLPVPLFAYGIPRRVGSAVVRNRLRRRLRSALVRVPADPHPGRYLLRAGPGAGSLTWAEVWSHTDTLIRSASRRRPPA